MQQPPTDDGLGRSKALLRRDALIRRDATSPEERARYSQALNGHLLAAGAASGEGVLAVYAACGSEPSLEGLIEHARSLGRRLAFPRVVERGLPLAFHLVGSPAELRPARFGLLEPLPSSPTVGLEAIELFLVPGLAFDRQGGRLGHGAGYFDRTLRAAAQARRQQGLGRAPAWGVAFTLQLVPEVPMAPWDVPVDALATDEGVRTCGSGLAAAVLSPSCHDNPRRHA